MVSINADDAEWLSTRARDAQPLRMRRPIAFGPCVAQTVTRAWSRRNTHCRHDGTLSDPRLQPSLGPQRSALTELAAAPGHERTAVASQSTRPPGALAQDPARGGDCAQTVAGPEEIYDELRKLVSRCRDSQLPAGTVFAIRLGGRGAAAAGPKA